MKSLKQFEIPLPPLAEQQRIAAILDKADALRTKRRAALAKLDTLLQSIFLHMFGDPITNPMGWPFAKLGDVIDFQGGSQPAKKHFTTANNEDTIRLVQIRDFKTDKYKIFIPRSMNKRYFEEDDVMIARYGPPVFQILRGLSGSYNVALMKASPKDDITKDFIFYLLQSPNLHNFVVLNSQRTAGQSGVNLKLLNAYPSYIPPIELQNEFSKIVNRFDKIKKNQQISLGKLDDTFHALQQRAFKGEL